MDEIHVHVLEDFQRTGEPGHPRVKGEYDGGLEHAELTPEVIDPTLLQRRQLLLLLIILQVICDKTELFLHLEL